MRFGSVTWESLETEPKKSEPCKFHASMPAGVSAESVSGVTFVSVFIRYKKKRQEVTKPTSTATVKSKITVRKKVKSNVALYDIVIRRKRLNSAQLPMLEATENKMADKAANGMLDASGAAATTTINSVMACTTPAIGETAPLLILVTVRAIVPVAGMPPKKGTTMLAMPCPINS